MPERSDNPTDGQMAEQFERIIRRVRQSMNYRGSYSTRDNRWLHSGEWERLKRLAPEERHIGESVRRFILDRFDQLRRRGQREDLEDEVNSVAERFVLSLKSECLDKLVPLGERHLGSRSRSSSSTITSSATTNVSTIG